MKYNAISKKLGIATEGPVTKAIAKKKAKILRAGLEKDRYHGKLRDTALRYAQWYERKARKSA